MEKLEQRMDKLDEIILQIRKELERQQTIIDNLNSITQSIKSN